MPISRNIDKFSAMYKNLLMALIRSRTQAKFLFPDYFPYPTKYVICWELDNRKYIFYDIMNNGLVTCTAQ